MSGEMKGKRGRKDHRKQRQRDHDQMSIIVPFGKHKGKPWDLVPTHYLQWCIDEFDKSSDYALLVRLILRMRESKGLTDDSQRLNQAQAKSNNKQTDPPHARRPKQRQATGEQPRRSGKNGITYLYDQRDRTKLYYTPGQPHPIPEGIVIGTPDEPCPFD
jgi:uncharacterized protein (DUF3820 family)